MEQNVKNQNIQYDIKTIIIKNKYNTGKELLNYILKEKYKNNINFIKITQDNFKLLDQEHLITIQLYGCAIHSDALKTYINEIYFNKNIRDKYYELEKENLTN